MLGSGKSMCKNPEVGSSLLDFLEGPLQEGALTTRLSATPHLAPTRFCGNLPTLGSS